MDKSFRLFSALVVFGIFILNTLATKFGWYTIVPSFDMLMHALGGFWVGTAIPIIFPKIRSKMLNSFSGYIFQVVVCVFLVTILWEFFEYSVQSIVSVRDFLATPVDSVSDIFLGVGGGVFGAWLAYYYYSYHS